MKKMIICLMMLSTSSFAADGFEVLSHVGEIYNLNSGPCAAHMDIMKWGVAVDQGVVSFAQTNTPKVRPLTGYVSSATISAKNLHLLGEGEFTYEFNQPTPIKAEYKFEGENKLTIYAYNKGKGSWGSILGDPGFAGTNQKFQYDFSSKNSKGIYQELTTTYQNFKGLVNGKKQVCKFTLAL